MPLGHPSAAPITLYGEASISPKLFTKLYSCSLFCIPNHQSAFCWIYLLFLTRSIITWIPLRWFESYLTGRSFRVAWGGEVSKAHQLATGVPQGSRFLDPSLFFTYTTSLGPIIQAHGFSYHCYADDTQRYLSFRPDDPMVAAQISGCLADISAWIQFQIYLYSTFKKQPRLTKVLHNVRKSSHTNKIQ